MDKRAKDRLVRSRGENGGGQDAQKHLHLRIGRDENKGKTQEKMERGSRKRSSSAGNEKMERVGDGQEKWKDIVRQAKAHSGLQCQWKKRKKKKKEKNEEKEKKEEKKNEEEKEEEGKEEKEEKKKKEKKENEKKKEEEEKKKKKKKKNNIATNFLFRGFVEMCKGSASKCGGIRSFYALWRENMQQQAAVAEEDMSDQLHHLRYELAVRGWERVRYEECK